MSRSKWILGLFRSVVCQAQASLNGSGQTNLPLRPDKCLSHSESTSKSAKTASLEPINGPLPPVEGGVCIHHTPPPLLTGLLHVREEIRREEFLIRLDLMYRMVQSFVLLN